MKKSSKLLILSSYLIIWALLSFIVGNELYLPGPIRTLAAFFAILCNRESYIFLIFTSFRVILATLISLIFGLFLGFATGYSKSMRLFFRPLVNILRSTPIVSLIMLALLWLNSNFLPVFISFLMAMPIFWTATEAAILSRDKNLLEMMKVFKVSKSKVFIYYDLRWTLNKLSLAFKQAFGFAWKAGVAAEVLAFSPLSIGRKIMESKTYLESTDLFAWTLILLILSFIMERLIEVAFRKCEF